MTRAMLEVTRYDEFYIDTSLFLDMPMLDPMGTKPMITVILSGSGTGLSSVEFRSSAFATISCTPLFTQTAAGMFWGVWYAQNVPINSSPTTYLRLSGAVDQIGAVEVGYWDAISIAHAYSDGPHNGTSASMTQASGSTDTDTIYGLLSGFPSSNTTLAGSSDMVAVDGYGVIPPEYTNSHGVNVGFAPPAGAPRATTGFIHGPTTAGYTFAFAWGAPFGDTMTWWLNLIRLTGPRRPPFYQHSDEVAGFHYDGSTFTHFGSPLSGAVNAAASVVSSPSQVYAIKFGLGKTLSISTDGGLTWIERAIAPLSAVATDIYSLWAPAVGEVYFAYTRGVGFPTPSLDGIWRTLDDGVTWSRIVALTETGFGVHMAVGLTKLFYAVCVSASPFGSPTWAFRRCNFDGTGVETITTHTFPFPPALLLRAISDDFLLASGLYKIDATGVSDISPFGTNRAYDAVPLTASEWVAVGAEVIAGEPHNVLVYRTTNAGSSWTLVTTIPDNQGFALSARDNYFMVSAPQTAASSDVVMLGNAAFDVQQIFWISTDAGVTWSQLINTADPNPGGAARGPGGLASVCPVPIAPMVAIPSRLATIVG